jgi:FkbM family methyltransferase
MLYRALASVDRGFYVDIGAQHPEIDSVSCAFFERGWTGVHVEPVPEYAAMLRQARAGDTVIEAAVSNAVGEITLTVFPETGLSTVEEHVVADHSSRDDGVATREAVVPAITLVTLADHIGDREVHWLKIDVEGHEKAVLEGWDSSRLRPWICLIEATAPNSLVSTHTQWEHILLGAGYEYVYSDGLNRFYVASEKAGLLRPAFETPPNVFDDVQLGEYAGMCRELMMRNERRLSAQRRHYEAELLDLTETHYEMIKTFNQQLQDAAHQSHALQLHLDMAQHATAASEAANSALLSSFSWRLTAPLRMLVDLLALIKGAILRAETPAAPASAPAAPVDEPPTRSPAKAAWLARLDEQIDGADR